MLAATLLLFPIMFTGLRISRWEGGMLLSVYFAYLWILLTT
jgi:Ca2+/Na+ antiporter